MRELRVVVVLNPRASAGARLHARALARLRDETCVLAQIATQADAGDVQRITEVVERLEPDVLVAAGGDGTAGLALRALLASKRAQHSALGFLPLGTGNNAARSFGLRALGGGERALELAAAAIATGARREVDVGVVDDRPFLGSFAIGMDADVLNLRNRVQGRLDTLGLDGGWSLYLGGVAASLMRGVHGGNARLSIDGAREARRVYGLSVINAPVYAGPIRFDAENDCADGLLDVLVMSSAWEYVSEYARAWPRYLRVRGGFAAAPSPLLRRAHSVRIEFERPVAAQADGEPLGAASTFRVGVLARALRVCLPDA